MNSEPSEYSTEHRNLLLQKLISNVPYVSFLGVKFEQKDDDFIRPFLQLCLEKYESKCKKFNRDQCGSISAANT